MHLHLEHSEKHFTASDTVRDVVVGMSDGLTVPFALAAGISGAIAISHLVVTAGLAEIAAGSIAMGLGGYLAGRSESEHYASERRREEAEVTSTQRLWIRGLPSPVPRRMITDCSLPHPAAAGGHSRVTHSRNPGDTGGHERT
jgi:VIT family